MARGLPVEKFDFSENVGILMYNLKKLNKGFCHCLDLGIKEKCFMNQFYQF